MQRERRLTVPGTHLDVAGVAHEAQGLLLVPFRKLAAAEHEAKLAALGE